MKNDTQRFFTAFYDLVTISSAFYFRFKLALFKKKIKNLEAMQPFHCKIIKLVIKSLEIIFAISSTNKERKIKYKLQI